MRAPDSVFIVLTTECDKAGECGHCFYNVQPDRHKPERMNTATLKRVLKKLRLLNLWNVYLSGGEPLLRDDLEDIISYLKQLGMYAFLLSNGRSLTSDRVKDLDRAGLDVFALSLSSLDMQDRKTVNLVRRFNHAVMSMIFVITARNYEVVPDILEMHDALHAGVIFQPAFIPPESEVFSELSPWTISPFDWSQLHANLQGWARRCGYEDYLKMVYDFYHKRDNRPSQCTMGSKAFVIDADGSVYPCFHRRDLDCGNVLKDDIGEIMHRLSVAAPQLKNAACFGEHCISLHTGPG